MSTIRYLTVLTAGVALGAMSLLGGCSSSSHDPMADLPSKLPTDAHGRPTMIARDSIGTLIYRDKPGGIAHSPAAASQQQVRLSTVFDEEID